jgi:uncharacterized protein
VAQPRNPLRVNVGFLINQPIGTSRDIHFEYPQLNLSDLELKNLAGKARFSRTQVGILVQGDFTAETAMECARCLGEAQAPLHSEFDELFEFRWKATADSGLVLPEDASIDLEPLAYEYFMIELPIKPVCREDCKGLCEECGANLNLETCEHQAQLLSGDGQQT